VLESFGRQVEVQLAVQAVRPAKDSARPQPARRIRVRCSYAAPHVESPSPVNR
jgi:hypothetical protein